MDWSRMGVREQTDLTVDCFPNLAKDRVDKVLAEWATHEYADNWSGHQRAQADLMKMLRWESMSADQQDEETARHARRKT